MKEIDFPIHMHPSKNIQRIYIFLVLCNLLGEAWIFQIFFSEKKPGTLLP